MTDWQTIDTAPRDGTVIEVKNPVMDGPVLAKFSDYKSSYGSKSKQFVLVRDPDRFMPLPPGTLVIPTHWRLPQDTSGAENEK